MVSLTDHERIIRCYNCSGDVDEDVRLFANISNHLSSNVDPSVVLLLVMQYDFGPLIIMKASLNGPKK